MSNHLNQYGYSGQLVYQAYEYRQGNERGEGLPAALPDGDGKEGLSHDCERSYTRKQLIEILENSLSSTSTRMPNSFDAYRVTQYSLGEQIEVWDSEIGSIRNGRQIQSSEGEIAILSPGRLLIRGTRQFATDIESHTSRNLPEGDRLLPIEFEPEFLLWIFEGQQTNSLSRFRHLTPIRLNGASFSGDQDEFGTNVSLESAKLADSGLVHASILSGNRFKDLSGLFELNDRYIQVTIYSNGRMHISAAEDLRNRNMAERFVTASQVVDQLVAEYLRWHELPLDEQYPPASFFKDLYTAANTQGIDVSADIDSMLENYAERRGESLEHYLESD